MTRLRYLSSGDEITTPLPFTPDEEQHRGGLRLSPAATSVCLAALLVLGLSSGSAADELPQAPAGAPIVEEEYGNRLLRPTVAIYVNRGGGTDAVVTPIVAEEDEVPSALDLARVLARTPLPLRVALLADDEIPTTGLTIDEDGAGLPIVAPWSAPRPPQIIRADDEQGTPLRVDETERGPLPPPEYQWHTIPIPNAWDDGTDFALTQTDEESGRLLVTPRTAWRYPPPAPVVADDEIASTLLVAVEDDDRPRLWKWATPALVRAVSDDDVIVTGLAFDEDPAPMLARPPIPPQPRVYRDDVDTVTPLPPIIEDEYAQPLVAPVSAWQVCRLRFAFRDDIDEIPALAAVLTGTLSIVPIFGGALRVVPPLDGDLAVIPIFAGALAINPDVEQ